MTECLTCDRPFTPFPTHPMVEAAHCDECRAILEPVWFELAWAEMYPAGEFNDAMRADDV